MEPVGGWGNSFRPLCGAALLSWKGWVLSESVAIEAAASICQSCVTSS